MLIHRPAQDGRVRSTCTDGPVPVPTCIQVLGDPGRTVHGAEVQVSGQLGYFWFEEREQAGHRFFERDAHGG